MFINKLSFPKVVFYSISFSTIFILIYNILHYTPILGYDGEAHYLYVDYLSRYLPNSLKLPSISETREFFSPPLGYLVPSFAQVACRNIISSYDYLNDCRPIYGKITQVVQSLIYVLTIYINLYALKIINKSKSIVNPEYLLLVSLMAVNYRTISMIRGETYIILFLSIFLLSIYKSSEKDFMFDFRLIIINGLVIGLIALSRQWGFLLFIPIIFMLFSPRLIKKIEYLKFWSLSASIGIIISGWFYLNLFFKYGSFTAFNLNRQKFSFANQPLNFYFPTFEELYYVFNKPIRPYLNNQFLSTLYSDLWGDYWGYFTFTSRYLDIGRNQNLIGDYFARVNKISLITTFVIVLFCYLSSKHFKEMYIVRYINWAIITSFFGYLLFAISYPIETGDTVKSSYIIQLFHLAAFSSSIYFYKLRSLNKAIYIQLLVVLSLIYIHNFQSFLSHFPRNFYP